ncbi:MULTISPECIES: iron-sulfur cluster assembly scaffold protein [unclassified Adlercreutzia]|uniref:iron-sulfur cluster assembly scaffold protein n=1 Tax=unclassified Adlercreutzia TaxID=2636013 RepID=UPI001F150BFE|nr:MULTISPECIES: iron-sulfur cluster assembly scaffold protein [unclassified Adlercreutzia]
MGDVRNVYIEPKDRVLLRTADVYQTEVDAGVEGYSDTLLSVVANFRNAGRPEGFNAQSMAGKSKRGEVACRLFAVVAPAAGTEGAGGGAGAGADVLQRFVIERAGFKTRGCLAMTGCASVACSMIEGRTLGEALAVTTEGIRAALDGVPEGKANTLYFAVCAIRGLVGDFLAREGVTRAELDAAVPCEEYSVPCMMCEHCSLRDMRVEMLVDEQRAEEERAECRALATVFDDVRAQSASSELVSPVRWEERGWVPAHLSAEDFEMLVYDHLETWRAEQAEDEGASLAASAGMQAEGRADAAGAGAQTDAAGAGSDAAGAAGAGANAVEAANAAGASAEAASAPLPTSLYASRSVGVPRLFVRAAGAEASALPAMPETKRSIEPPASAPADAGLNIPEGFELVQLEGEWVLVETGEPAEPAEVEVNPAHIKALVGVRSYYLFDSSIMTDAYAHWAFLAAEDNPLVTFADCVREDARVYPRPMARSSFANPPFRMDAEAVEAAWEASRAHADYADLERIEASNGDVYFFSTTYLSPERACALAEWDAVERYFSV